MNATLQTIRDLSRPAEAASELHELSMELAYHDTIPAAIRERVRELIGAVDAETASFGQVDPYYVELVLRAALSAQIALMEPEAPDSRLRLRMALDSLAQAFASIAEDQPVSDDRSGKELVAWLVAITEAPQAQIAQLIGVSPRQFQRWLSPSESASPEGDDLRRVRAIARIVNQLRFSLTPAGVVDWFSWRSPELGRKRPIDLLDKPAQLPRLIGLASDLRSTTAT
jgi:uncharacterized protein (DUF2384 family)